MQINPVKIRYINVKYITSGVTNDYLSCIISRKIGRIVKIYKISNIYLTR